MNQLEFQKKIDELLGKKAQRLFYYVATIKTWLMEDDDGKIKSVTQFIGDSQEEILEKMKKEFLD